MVKAIICVAMLACAAAALQVTPLINNNAFFLVTSAGHMPRAIGTFKKLNMTAVPAPTEFQLPEDYERAPLSPHSERPVVCPR